MREEREGEGEGGEGGRGCGRRGRERVREEREWEEREWEGDGNERLCHFQISVTQIHVAVSNFKRICTRGRCVHTSTVLCHHMTPCVYFSV